MRTHGPRGRTRLDSIYQRMIEVRPETAGHVANLAQAGAPASRLARAGPRGAVAVPTPALAIIQTIDNDIRCDGTDASHVAEFGAQVANALTVIGDGSPRSHILVLTQGGRPAAELKEMATLIARNPTVKKNDTGPHRAALSTPRPANPFRRTSRTSPRSSRRTTRSWRAEWVESIE